MLIVDKLKPFPRCDIAQDDKSLAAWCRWWRDALGLMDWTFDVVYARFYEMDDTCGRAEIHQPSKYASVQIMCAIDVSRSDAPFDPEHALVHELLHVKLWHHGHKDPDTIDWTLSEQVIDTLAWSLVNLRRMKHG